jgi:hypothetical protein
MYKLNDDEMNTYIILVGKPGRKETLRSPRCKWHDDFKMDHEAIGWKGVDWIHLTQDGGNERLW